MRPKVNRWHKKHDFTHPFPHLQENRIFDDDFVKDGNKDDGGEWLAQERYDRLRVEIAKAHAEMVRAKVELEHAKKSVESARVEQAHAEGDAKHAESTAEAAQRSADVDRDRAERQSAAFEGQAAGNAQSKMSELRRCKEALKNTEQVLERLLEEQRSDDGGLADLRGEEAELATKAGDDEKMEESLEEEVGREKTEYDAAKAVYDKELAELQQTRVELDQTAERIHRFRRQNDPDGGVYWVGPKSETSEDFRSTACETRQLGFLSLACVLVHLS